MSGNILQPFEEVHNILSNHQLEATQYYSLLFYLRPAIVLGSKLYSQKAVAEALRISPNQLSLYLKFTDAHILNNVVDKLHGSEPFKVIVPTEDNAIIYPIDIQQILHTIVNEMTH